MHNFTSFGGFIKLDVAKQSKKFWSDQKNTWPETVFFDLKLKQVNLWPNSTFLQVNLVLWLNLFYFILFFAKKI